MLTIGQLASATGVPTSTIRFWERKGLFAPAYRSGGQRRYDEEALYQVGLLLLCQDAGFTLAEIQRIMDRRNTDSTRWREVVEAKMADVGRRLAKLHRAHDLLAHALECRHDDIRDCPDFRATARQRVGAGAGPATASGLPARAG